MACDGNIAEEEVNIICKTTDDSNMFGDLDVQKNLNDYVGSINVEGKSFLSKYLKEVADTELTDEQSIELLKLAINTIEADHNIEYPEVSFFKKIRSRLSVSDEKILEAIPDKEDYLLPDIEIADDFDWSVSFEEITIPAIHRA